MDLIYEYRENYIFKHTIFINYICTIRFVIPFNLIKTNFIKNIKKLVGDHVECEYIKQKRIVVKVFTIIMEYRLQKNEVPKNILL